MEQRNLPLVLSAIFAVIVVGGTVDLVLDNPDTIFSAHVLFEVGMIVVSVVSAAYLGFGWWRTQRTLVGARRDLERGRAERDDWRRRTETLLSGLGDEIDRQLDHWELTPSERETALLVLKGLSHKEIARLTRRSEKTVRQHAVGVYRKSGLGGRAELSAFFLEDLLAPLLERAPDLESVGID